MQSTRRLILFAGLGLAAGLPSAPARAGSQIEEPLADAVRTALSAAVSRGAPPRPSFASTEERLAYLRWLGAMSQRLQKRKAEHLTRVEFLETLWYESHRAGLDPVLAAGGDQQIGERENDGGEGEDHALPCSRRSRSLWTSVRRGRPRRRAASV